MEPDKIYICDCTIRDGWLVDNSRFSLGLVRRVCRAASRCRCGYHSTVELKGIRLLAIL